MNQTLLLNTGVSCTCGFEHVTTRIADIFKLAKRHVRTTPEHNLRMSFDCSQDCIDQQRNTVSENRHHVECQNYNALYSKQTVSNNPPAVFETIGINLSSLVGRFNVSS